MKETCHKNNKYYMIQFIWNVQNRQIYKQKVSPWLHGTGRDRAWVTTKGCRAPFWGDENVLKSTVVVGAHIWEPT